jgi:hypothetical protein
MGITRHDQPHDGIPQKFHGTDSVYVVEVEGKLYVASGTRQQRPATVNVGGVEIRIMPDMIRTTIHDVNFAALWQIAEFLDFHRSVVRSDLLKFLQSGGTGDT